MEQTIPGSDNCLTADEKRELQAAWSSMERVLQPLDELVKRAGEVDCDALHTAFLNLSNAFDCVERLIMSAKQVRLMREAQAAEKGLP